MNVGEKKAQVTVFIILGLVLVGVVFLGIYIFKNISESNKENDEKNLQTEAAQLEQVNVYVKSCLEMAAKDSVYGVIGQGGYDEIPVIEETMFEGRPIEETEYIYNPHLGAPYYIVKGQKSLPTLEEVENSISQRAMNYFLDCANNLTALETTNFEFEISEENSMNVDINGNNVLFNLNYPFKAKTKTSEYNLETYNYALNYEISSKYTHATSFIEEQSKDLNFIDVGYLSWLAHKEKFEFEIWEIAEKTYMFHFIYEDYKKMYDYPLMYSFIVEYA